MANKKHGWLKIAALAAGLVGTAVGVGALVKKNQEQKSHHIEFDSFEDELLMEAAEAQEEVNEVVAEMEEAFGEQTDFAMVQADFDDSLADNAVETEEEDDDSSAQKTEE